MIFKYTIRLIKSTFNRFMAILAIVFIGVSFMMGLRANYDIMQESVEKYNDDSNLYDIQIYSNFGFDDNDVKAIEKLDYISNVYPSRIRDVLVGSDNLLDSVVRLQEIDSSLNTIELKEGRMPEKENECLITVGYSTGVINIGDKFSVYLEDEDLNESFKNTEFEVVGIAKGAENMTEMFSTSTLNNKNLNIIAYIPNANFTSDYYSSLYLTVNGAKELFSFDDEYKNLIDEKEELLKDFSVNQSEELRNRIIEEANEKIEDAKKELERNRIKYQKELDDAKSELDKGKKELDDAKREIDFGYEQIRIGEEELVNGQKQIDDGYKELKRKEEEYKNTKEKIDQYHIDINGLLRIIDDVTEIYTDTNQRVIDLLNRKDEINYNLEQARIDIENSGCTSIEEAISKRNSLDKDEDSEQIEILNKAIDGFVYISIHENEPRIIDAINSIKESLDHLSDAVLQRYLNMNVPEALSYAKTTLEELRDGDALIAEGYKELELGQKKINDGRKEIEENKKKLEEGKIEYQKGLVKYQDGLKEYEKGVKEFNRKMTEAQDKIDDAKQELKDLDEVKWTVLKRYSTNYSSFMYRNTCEQMKSIGTIIPLLFFVVAALVCSTTMTRLIDEQRGQIGIYRALGFSKLEINGIYILYVIIASLGASVVALFIGVIIFPTIIYNTWRLLYDLPKIILLMPIDDVVICVSCFTVLMVFVTCVVLNGSLKESPAQLLRPKSPKMTKQTFIEKITFVWNNLSFTTKVTARNLLRYKTRFIMTIIGVAGCTSLLVMGWGIKDSISGVVDLQYSHINRQNYQISLKNDRHIDEIIDDLKMGNNDVYVPYVLYQSAIDVDGEEKGISTIVVDSNKQDDIYYLENFKTKEEVKLSDDGILVSDKFADTNNIHIGDLITFESKEGTKKEVLVKDIVINYVGSYVYISEKYYQEIFNEEIDYNLIGVLNRNNDINELLPLGDKYNDIIDISDFTEEIRSFQDMLDALNLIILIIIVVAGALAFVVLINLTNVNISERIREIATLKVLGFREREVNSYIFKEVMLMSLVGGIVGLPIGKLEERYIMTVINMDFCKFPHIVHPISYIYAFTITIIFTIIVLFLTRKTLRKVEMVESLKSVE